jgi:hypothetical protein
MYLQDIDYFFNVFGMDLVRSIIAIFVVIDPIGTIPLFIAITHKKTKKERNDISKTAVITANICDSRYSNFINIWNHYIKLYGRGWNFVVHNISGVANSWILEIWRRSI